MLHLVRGIEACMFVGFQRGDFGVEGVMVSLLICLFLLRYLFEWSAGVKSSSLS